MAVCWMDYLCSEQGPRVSFCITYGELPASAKCRAFRG